MFDLITITGWNSPRRIAAGTKQRARSARKGTAPERLRRNSHRVQNRHQRSCYRLSRCSTRRRRWRSRLGFRRTSSGRSVYNYFRDYDPVTGRYVEEQFHRAFGRINTYGYGVGNPIGNYDAHGLECVSANGVTTCSHPSGPKFRVPHSARLPARMDSSEFVYHQYDVAVPIGCARAENMMTEIVNAPTPGRPEAASEAGSRNNAMVIPGVPNLVTSYLTKDLNPGCPLVVNVTDSDTNLPTGYTARMVKTASLIRMEKATACGSPRPCSGFCRGGVMDT